MTEFPYRLVTVDIDGTLTLGHGWKFLAAQIGRLEEFDRTNQRFRTGEESEDDHLSRLIGIAGGMSLSELAEVLAATPKIHGIEEAVAEFHDRGARVALLTHNPTFVCDWYRRTFGFDDSEGSAWPLVPSGTVARTAQARADKRTGLERLLARHHVEPSQTAHAGDGRADAVIFPLVGAGVALNSTLQEVEEAADLALHLTNLRRLVQPLSELPPRPVGPLPPRA